MKSQFSTAWQSSTQPRKQRKYRHNAPLHTMHRFLSAHLSKDLRTKYGKRSLPLRKGDEVLVMRGSFKKKKGKISQIDLKNHRVAIDGIQRAKRDGTKVNVFISAHALLIVTPILDDKERQNALNRKAQAPTVKVKKEAKIHTKKENKGVQNAPNKKGSVNKATN